MISDSLLRARTFEQKYIEFQDPKRPCFHVTGTVGWINDPNGFSVYKGEYHLFYQYHPYSKEWGPMHWGHVKTKDFIRWERLPAALAPDTEADRDGCFSGSALELEDGRQLLMYTGVYKETGEDLEIREYQRQSIALGDGINYVKYEGNPVLDADDLPEGGSLYDFRDPKIWKEGGSFFAVVANRAADESGSVLLFRSEDGFYWKYVKILVSNHDEFGKMWECPDFFSLDGEQVLVVSPQDMVPMGLEFHAGNGVVCMMGGWDREKCSFQRERAQSMDYGIDFYAPQTVETIDGRRVMIAWMQNWATSRCQDPTADFFGMMTVPRELGIRNGRLIQNPVRELENYRQNRVTYQNVLVNRQMNLAGIFGRVMDLTVQVRPATEMGYAYFQLNVGEDGEHGAFICYEPGSSIVKVDRTRSGGCFDIVHERSFFVRPQEGRVKIRVVMDKNSLEIFVNDGEQAASFLLYSPVTAQAVSFGARGAALMDVEKYDLVV
ncbi:MAG: glycoside hydrolase family 32 protein [Lachnospiraceae bacterium]|nr:glycoside hydrolase family 32 protein [Lachnospiraceae bacterium]